MSLTVNSKDLLEGLQQIIKVIPSRSTLPILGCAYFDFNENFITIKSTNLETSISVNIKYSGEKPDEPIALPINRLLEIIANIKDEKVVLNLSSKTTLKLETNTGTFSITGQDYKEFPSDPILKEKLNLSINTKRLLNIIDFTKTSTSKDELKPALQGVLFKINNGQILGVSTDGHRLARIIVEEETLQDQNFEIIVPMKFLTILSSIISNTETIELEISSNYMSLSYKNVSLFSKIIKDTYPDYEKVIPLDNNKTLTVDKKQLIESIKRVSIFSNRSTKQITFNIHSGRLELSTEDAENAASGKETVECLFNSDEDLKIGFNAGFVLDALATIEGESINMFLNSALSAAIISEKTDKNKTDKLILLMPIRLND